jgi:DNA polymerase III delta prime subunit
MDKIEAIKRKASILNHLSNDEEALFEYINTNKSNIGEVVRLYQPERLFRPVNTLRFLIANELQKGTVINKSLIDRLKEAIENRDVFAYYSLNEEVKQSLINYKNSKVGMFPNWSHNFKILFPFIYSNSENEKVLSILNQLADEIVELNNLEKVTKHIVGFQGAQNYGTVHVWLAIIPESAPSVQYAYQIFFKIDTDGLSGGIYKGHNLKKQEFENKDQSYAVWENYLDSTTPIKDEWLDLNSRVNFLFINDEKEFIKRLKKTDVNALKTYFKTLDRLVEDLKIQDKEALVFSIANNQLSFQIGKRFCLNLKKEEYEFITSDSYEIDGLPKVNFAAPDNAYLYSKAQYSNVETHYDAIKDAIESELERDIHTEPKSYDNSAFRKAIFDITYREKILNKNTVQAKYYLVGAYWEDHLPQDQTDRFVSNNIWVNGFDDKFINIVKKIPENSHLAIKTVDRKGDRLFIKARGIVTSNKNDGQNLEVQWEENFKEFKLNFSGGYWQTLHEVKKKNHIDAIWSNNENMENVKEEFIDWYISNPRSSYFNNDPIKLDEYLTKSAENFTKDIFSVSASSFKEIIDFLEETINNNKTKFLKNHGANDSGKLAAIVGKRNYQKFLLEYFNEKNDNPKENVIVNLYKPTINQILYGPPGTGKTYALKQDYFPFYTSKETSITSEKNFETVVKKLSWWEVIAIALIQLGKSKVNDIYDHKWIQKKVELSNSKTVKPTLWGQLQSHTVESCEFVNVKSKQQPLIFNKTKNSTWDIIAEEVENQIPELYDLIDKVENFIPNPDKVIERFKFVTFHQSFSYEDFIEGIKPIMPENGELAEDLGYQIEDGVFKEICEEASNDPNNRYAIFIDEINRGNVSAIFGELITLIELDKRQGEKNEMQITLPYSKKLFSVPSNLDIYGTMNTADRSVEALDTALRRRFEFKEMMPDYSVIADETVEDLELSVVLETINQRIELLIDRDHTIGHSYFVNVNSTKALAKALNNKIVPLLQEYFYGDYGKIGLVLGKGFIEKKENKAISFADFKYENSEDFKTPTFVLKQVDSASVVEAVNLLLGKIEVKDIA